MRVSCNEVEALIRRAALGRGWSHGLSQEVAYAGAALISDGADGLSAVLDALDQVPMSAHALTEPGYWRFDQQPCVAVGPSIFELLVAHPDALIELKGCDTPRLLFGYARVAGERFRTRFRLKTSSEPDWRYSDDVVADLASLARGADVLVELDKTQPTRRQRANGPFTVDRKAWSQLTTLAQNSYVTPTTASRQHGAGAGLSDND